MKDVGKLMKKKNKIVTNNITVDYGDKRALHGIDLKIEEKEVTALIGPSGCGKSTFIRCLNRMNDLITGCKVEGSILIDGTDINLPDTDIVELRARIGNGVSKTQPFS